MVAASKGRPNVSIGNVIVLILFIILGVGAVIGFDANIWACKIVSFNLWIMLEANAVLFPVLADTLI